MGTEIAITSTDPLTVDDLMAAAATFLPECLAVEFLGGELWVIVDDGKERVLTMFASKEIVKPDDVTHLLGREVRADRWWTSVSVPFGRPEPGLTIARHLAHTSGSAATAAT